MSCARALVGVTGIALFACACYLLWLSGFSWYTDAIGLAGLFLIGAFMLWNYEQ